jgi:arabinan endo-1,5-alpha-L-arabinosidase
MKMVKLDSTLTAVAQPEEWYTIAARKRDPILPDSVAGDAAIEAPFVYKHDKYYYLFVSFDYCCRGEKSTYKMMVGRSEKVMGPYTDRDGVPMNLGGGSLVLEGNKNWHGVGHNAVAAFNGIDYLVYHAYDANDNGRSKLQIEKIAWINGWPVVGRRPGL